MAETKSTSSKPQVSTAASSGTKGSNATAAFNNSVDGGSGGVYTSGGVTVPLDKWTKQWFDMPESKRMEYVDLFNKLGKRVNQYTGVNVWTDYGRASISTLQSGGKVTPDQLISLDLKDSYNASASGVPAFTAQDASSIIQGAYQQLLGRDAGGDEYHNALNLSLNQAKQTGAAGRQQAVIDYIKSGEEYKAKKENSYLDALYNSLKSRVGEVQA
jgi:hypothetical protein